MYDPKFEKAVQQKMEELEFRPAESVWANIEKAVADRRHRRSFFFWRYLLPGLFLAAGAGVWYFEAKTTKPAPADQNARAGTAAATTAPTNPGTAATTAAPTNQGTAATTAAPTNTGKAEAATARAKAPAATTATVPAAATTKTTRAAGTTAPAAATTPATAATRSALTSTAAPEKDGSTTVVVRRASQPPGKAGSVRSPLSAGVNSFSPSSETTTDPTPIAPFTDAVEKNALSESRKTWLYQPELARQTLIANIRANALTTKKATNSIGLQQTKRPWEAGFVVGGGLSRLNRLDADKANAAVAYSASSFYAINRSAYNKNFISDVRPDASFTGGIYLQKALSVRWIFNSGMNLHYYSTRITTGQQVSTYVQQSVSLIVPSALTLSSTAPIYSSGDMQVHTNRYYFLELPAAIRWKLSQSRVLPIFVEGGLSLTRLMSTDALFYNEKSGVYSKDGNVVNKTQFNISSALMFGLPIHGIRIQLGPQIQYGLTPLVNSQSLGDQHFFYTGIRLVVLPGKK